MKKTKSIMIALSAKRAEFEKLLDTVMDDFTEHSELTYQEEFSNWLAGKRWSWLSPIEVNADNYFDIAEVLHALLTVWHDGKHGYEILCQSQFRPGMGWRESDVEEYECYYDVKALIENDQGEFLGYDEIEKLMNELNEFIDKRSDDE